MSDYNVIDYWRVLISLVGHPHDGSDTTVKLFWDDATMTPFIIVGKKSYYVEHGSFESVILKIKEELDELDKLTI